MQRTVKSKWSKNGDDDASSTSNQYPVIELSRQRTPFRSRIVGIADMGGLQQFEFNPNSQWSSSRFSLLMMDHDEYYFRWHETVAHFEIMSNQSGKQSGKPSLDLNDSGTSPSAPICAPGLLHICGSGIFFEPHDKTLPILRATYRSFKRLTPWILNERDRSRLQSLGIGFTTCEGEKRLSTAKPTIRGWLGKLVNVSPSKRECEMNAPWELFSVDAEPIIALCSNSMNHPFTKLESFGSIHFAVKPDLILRDEERSALEMISVLVAIQVQSSPADCSALLEREIISHESQELGHSPLLGAGEVAVCRGRSVQVEPLLHIPGRFLLTNKAIYFRGFHKRRHDEELCISLSSLFRVFRRRHMFDKTGVELKQKNGCSYLFIFSSHDDCVLVWRHLSCRPSLYVSEDDELAGIMKAWQMGAISNFHYLLHLNSMADRSFHDIAQYPVMPWVIKDYTSESLDLSSKESFRDLSKPVGALQPARLFELLKRFEAMDEPKYLYGTHYSTPAYVVFFLVRKAPLLALRFHGGKFDNADRAFSSIESTWSTCLQNPADVKELIPEFYSGDGEFLLNKQMLPLGVKQCGEVVHDVRLPAWSSSPRDFVSKCRAALESDHVSSTLNLWIDLIFGCLQRGDAAIQANNLFHPFSYEGSVVLQDIADACSRRACFDHISEFGQIPKQLFKEQHPRRSGPVLMRPISAAQPHQIRDGASKERNPGKLSRKSS